MKQYAIKSPSGKIISVYAETIYHACDKAVFEEGFKYKNADYLKLNKNQK